MMDLVMQQKAEAEFASYMHQHGICRCPKASEEFQTEMYASKCMAVVWAHDMAQIMSQIS
jgi:hypothetical protein